MLYHNLDNRPIEYRLIPGEAGVRAPLVMLHEGLGSAGLWRDLPDILARRLRRRTMAYSRYGYGGSAPLERPRKATFMHEEAQAVLPRLIEDLGLERPLLIGHSDGASIATIFACERPLDVVGCVLIAPHVLVEPPCLAKIAGIKTAYAQGDLRQRLARYHAHVDDAFLGWADTWLSPEFAGFNLVPLLKRLSTPLLLVQGTGDPYGTRVHVDTIAAAAKGPVTTLLLEGVGHAPHVERQAQVLDAIEAFAGALP